MSIEELRARLVSGDAYKSLAAEKEVISECKKHGWEVIHSCYYDDLVDNKIRELDVLGIQRWQKKLAKNGDISLQLCLVAECKSAADYHLLFSDERVRSQYYLERYSHWLGSPGDERSKIIGFINRLDLPAAERVKVLKKFDEIAYPNDFAIIAPLHINPMPADFEFSAFRETNTKNERELESSVLWKATRSVGAAIASFGDAFWQTSLSDLNSAVESATLNGFSTGDELEETFDRRVRTVILFHPVVFLESHLWKVGDSDVESLEWCRLWQPGFWSFDSRWIDVVGRKSMPTYLKKLTEFYTHKLKKAGGKRLAPPV
jgi:hypothetical protein